MPMQPSPKADTDCLLWPSLRCCIDLSLHDFGLCLEPDASCMPRPARRTGSGLTAIGFSISCAGSIVRPIIRSDQRLVRAFRAFCATLESFFQSGCYSSAPRREGGPRVEELSLEFVRVVEEAAIAAARTMGRGDRHGSDQAAVEAMRRVLDTVPIAGTVVIGEGERDEAPMLFIGEKVGLKQEYSETVPEIDIAVDPLEGTNLCAMGVAGGLSGLAAPQHGGGMQAADRDMGKNVVGAPAEGGRVLWRH